MGFVKTKLDNDLQILLEKAKSFGYVLGSDGHFKSQEQCENNRTRYFLHIGFSSLGCGESLMKFELYDKIFEMRSPILTEFNKLVSSILMAQKKSEYDKFLYAEKFVDFIFDNIFNLEVDKDFSNNSSVMDFFSYEDVFYFNAFEEDDNDYFMDLRFYNDGMNYCGFMHVIDLDTIGDEYLIKRIQMKDNVFIQTKGGFFDD